MVLISCRNCRKVYEKINYDEFICTRCKHKVRRRVKNSLQISLALTISAVFLYFPAMLYPMMEVTQFGISSQSTILEGVISFLEHESYFIAIVIFVASVVIPLIKLVGLLFIFVSLKINLDISNHTKNKMFHFIEFIGKWSMIDIYVVAVLASIVQMGEIFNIKGGLSATSFALMVIVTIIAAETFDTRIIWDEER